MPPSVREPAPPSGKPRRKAAEDRKEDVIKIRVTGEQKRLLTAAAAADFMDVSAWLRVIAIKVASGR
ncbi:MAG: hypothetical protein ACHREM_04150 [Polyangiales bacterium]